MESFSHISIDPKELQGKRILVTGGTKGGMGEAIVKRLTKAGQQKQRLVITVRHLPQNLHQRESVLTA